MFGIKRTFNPFSRVLVDLTLEQTVNADAARRLTGIAMGKEPWHKIDNYFECV